MLCLFYDPLMKFRLLWWNLHFPCIAALWQNSLFLSDSFMKCLFYSLSFVEICIFYHRSCNKFAFLCRPLAKLVFLVLFWQGSLFLSSPWLEFAFSGHFLMKFMFPEALWRTFFFSNALTKFHFFLCCCFVKYVIFFLFFFFYPLLSIFAFNTEDLE